MKKVVVPSVETSTQTLKNSLFVSLLKTFFPSRLSVIVLAGLILATLLCCSSSQATENLKEDNMFNISSEESEDTVESEFTTSDEWDQPSLEEAGKPKAKPQLKETKNVSEADSVPEAESTSRNDTSTESFSFHEASEKYLDGILHYLDIRNSKEYDINPYLRLVVMGLTLIIVLGVVFPVTLDNLIKHDG